jgi:LuxR family maltose regulon positive regulatory protein
METLSSFQESKLIVISAPAGFGKTTLITEWIQDLDRPAGWISLDRGDNDVVRFLAYIVLTFQGIKDNFGSAIMELVQSTQRPSVETILTALINEAVELPDPLVLVLDDYHVIHEKPVHDAITYFIDHMPPNIQVVLSTRSDPPWPMARLRARGEMFELRAKDLRFTTLEATEFLNVVMGLNLTDESIEILEKRTEGWIVGLQMAALSMQGKVDTESFIAALSGSHRFVLDYLMEEVLEQQPTGIQEFLLRTSILERMSADLCDALTRDIEIRDWRLETSRGRTEDLQSPISSQLILEHLEHSNLFVTPLDDERVWYRYHHLFSDLLQSRLKQDHPELPNDLYSIASRWCEGQNFIAEAVQYALAAENFERAADLIEKHANHTIEYGGSTTLLGWLKELPEGILQDRPWIRVHGAWAMMHVGQLDAAEALVGRLEERLAEFGEDGAEDVQHLESHLIAARANLAEIRGDRPLAVRLSEEALQRLPPSDLRMKSTLLMLRSFSLQWSGNFEEAAKSSEAAVAVSKEIDNLRVSVAALNDLAALRIYQGRLRDALAICEQALEIVEESRRSEQGLLLQSEGVTYYYMSRIFLEWNDLDASMEAVSKGMDLSRRGGYVDIGVVGGADLVRTLLALGEIEKAQETILNIKSAYPELAAARLPAIEALILIALEDFSAARLVIEREGFSSKDDPSFNQLLMQRLLARVLVSEGRFDEALGFINRLKSLAEEKRVTRNTIELLKLQAIALLAMDKEDQAIEAMREALVLGKEEGFIRTFIDEGKVSGRLLRATKARGVEVEYVTKLLQELEKDIVRGEAAREDPIFSSIGAHPSLVDPLTERELQVLRLLRTELSAPEIAEQLFVAVSTVRSHTKSIYSKLEVHGRREAVARAEELGLL